MKNEFDKEGAVPGALVTVRWGRMDTPGAEESVVSGAVLRPGGPIIKTVWWLLAWGVSGVLFLVSCLYDAQELLAVDQQNGTETLAAWPWMSPLVSWWHVRYPSAGIKMLSNVAFWACLATCWIPITLDVLHRRIPAEEIGLVTYKGQWARKGFVRHPLTWGTFLLIMVALPTFIYMTWTHVSDDWGFNNVFFWTFFGLFGCVAVLSFFLKRMGRVVEAFLQRLRGNDVRWCDALPARKGRGLVRILHIHGAPDTVCCVIFVPATGFLSLWLLSLLEGTAYNGDHQFEGCIVMLSITGLIAVLSLMASWNSWRSGVPYGYGEPSPMEKPGYRTAWNDKVRSWMSPVSIGGVADEEPEDESDDDESEDEGSDDEGSDDEGSDDEGLEA